MEIKLIATPTNCGSYSNARPVGSRESVATSKSDGERNNVKTDMNHARGRHASAIEVDAERMLRVRPLLGPEKQTAEAQHGQEGPKNIQAESSPTNPIAMAVRSGERTLILSSRYREGANN